MKEVYGGDLDHFDDLVKEKIIQSEIEGGALLEDLAVGRTLEVTTHHHTYLIEKRADGYYISGHPEYCPDPIKATIAGSTFGGSILKRGFVGRGMHLEFTVEGNRKPITTSSIEEVVER